MLEEGYGHNEDQQLNHLIARFDDMISRNEFFYFDSEEIERIIDHYITNGNRNKIQEAIKLANKLFPFSVELQIKKTQVLLSYDEAAYALKELKKIEHLAQNNEDFIFTLAVAYSKLEQHPKSISYFERLLAKDKNNEEILSCLAYEYQSMGKYEESIKYLKDYLNNPKNELTWYSIRFVMSW